MLPETARHHGKVDVAGAITSTLGMTALVYGFVHAADAGWSDAVTLASFAAAVLLLGAFVLVERVAEAPITPLEPVRRPHPLGGVRRTDAAGRRDDGHVLLHDPAAADRDRLRRRCKAGLAFLPVTVGVLLASQLSARRLVEAIGPRATMVLGALVSASSVFWLSHTSSDPAYWTIGVPLFLMGLGNGTVFVPITGAALQGVEPRFAGAAAGLVNVAQQVGSTLGLAVLVTVFSAAGRHAAAAGPGTRDAVEQARHVFVSGADAALLVAAGLILLTALVATTMYRAPRRARPSAALVPALD